MCVRVKYRWRRPVRVRVSEVQCNCRQSQPYLPVKNTIIPHSPSQAISPVSSSLLYHFLSLCPSFSFSLSHSLPPPPITAQRAISLQDKNTTHKPSLSFPIATLLSPCRFFYPSVSFFPPTARPRSFPLLRAGEWKWTSCKHTPLIALYAVVYLPAEAGEVKAPVYEARGVGYLTRPADKK